MDSRKAAVLILRFVVESIMRPQVCYLTAPTEPELQRSMPSTRSKNTLPSEMQVNPVQDRSRNRLLFPTPRQSPFINKRQG
jgi:hypothetical protein